MNQQPGKNNTWLLYIVHQSNSNSFLSVWFRSSEDQQRALSCFSESSGVWWDLVKRQVTAGSCPAYISLKYPHLETAFTENAHIWSAAAEMLSVTGGVQLCSFLLVLHTQKREKKWAFLEGKRGWLKPGNAGRNTCCDGLAVSILASFKIVDIQSFSSLSLLSNNN